MTQTEQQPYSLDVDLTLLYMYCDGDMDEFGRMLEMLEEREEGCKDN